MENMPNTPKCHGEYRNDHDCQICGWLIGCMSKSNEREAISKKSINVQVGGDHYKDMKIQPVEYIYKNGIGYFEGCVIKYVSRWQKKGGVEDLKKARHFLDLLIEFEGE